MKKVLVSVLVALTMAATSMSVSCRGLGYGLGRLAVHAAATAVVTAIHVAVWYSLARAVYVYPNYGVQTQYYTLQPGERVYIIARSADGTWCQIRTADGRTGWVRYDTLSGQVREYR